MSPSFFFHKKKLSTYLFYLFPLTPFFGCSINGANLKIKKIEARCSKEHLGKKVKMSDRGGHPKVAIELRNVLEYVVAQKGRGCERSAALIDRNRVPSRRRRPGPVPRLHEVVKKKFFFKKKILDRTH